MISKIIQMRDSTAPEMSGTWETMLDRTQLQLEVTWEESPSADLKNYVVEVRRNSASAAPLEFETINPFRTISASEFALVEGETIYIAIQACDDAADTNWGDLNCTNFPPTSLEINDLSGPPGFDGIKAVANTNPELEGAVSINWDPPSSWAEYAGFIVFNLSSEGMETLKVCLVRLTVVM